MSYDDEGNKYELPVFCINDPTSYGDLTDPLKDVKFDKVKVKLRFRCAGTPNDIKMKIDNTCQISKIKDKYLRKAKLKGHSA